MRQVDIGDDATDGSKPPWSGREFGYVEGSRTCPHNRGRPYEDKVALYKETHPEYFMNISDEEWKADKSKNTIILS